MYRDKPKACTCKIRYKWSIAEYDENLDMFHIVNMMIVVVVMVKLVDLFLYDDTIGKHL